MVELEGAFVEALTRDDARGAVAALLELDTTIAGRIRAGEDSPDLDNAEATFRGLIARLGEHAADGGDSRSAIDPFVSALLEIRARARDAHDWALADLVRDRLTAAGIEVRDGPDGPTWAAAEVPPG